MMNRIVVEFCCWIVNSDNRHLDILWGSEDSKNSSSSENYIPTRQTRRSCKEWIISLSKSFFLTFRTPWNTCTLSSCITVGTIGLRRESRQCTEESSTTNTGNDLSVEGKVFLYPMVIDVSKYYWCFESATLGIWPLVLWFWFQTVFECSRGV